ncbi:MAG: PHP domain-containing protein, partial [Chloroflexi bacterium]|nr:PHP domain-containing protein [Chloroflexota bacterium]
LSERGLLAAGGSEQTFAREEDLYAALGMPWIPPEMREDRGEIQAALAGKLPHPVEIADIHSDLHTHSDWSDGVGTLRAMAEAARARGLKVLAITDHSGGLGITGGLTGDKVIRQRKEIDEVQRQMGDSILLLQGSEVEIHADGSLDFSDEVLAQLDLVVASLHTSLRQPREQVTARLLKAIRNPHVDIIGHPSGRLLPNREGADLDWEAVLSAAQEHGTVLEIDAHPHRLDLDEVYARRAGELGIPISIDSDAHAPEQFDVLKFGVSVARRAWLEPQQIINTWPAERLIKWLRDRGSNPGRMGA